MEDVKQEVKDVKKELKMEVKMEDVKPAIEESDQVQDLDLGIPPALIPHVGIGQCIPVSKKTFSELEIHADDSILDCPSQVVPLMIKRANQWPEKYIDPNKDESEDKEDEVKTPEKPVSSGTTRPNQMLTIQDFYKSSVGEFLLSIGLSRAKQVVLKHDMKQVQKKIRKQGEHYEYMEELRRSKEIYEMTRSMNSRYDPPQKIRCPHCEFRTENSGVLDLHLMSPHISAKKEYRCNWCPLLTKDPKFIVQHNETEHGKKVIIVQPPYLYECPYCQYETQTRQKGINHIAKCEKTHDATKNLMTHDSADYPTITPKPITQEDIKIYEATLQALRCAAMNPGQRVPQVPGLPPSLQKQITSINGRVGQPGQGGNKDLVQRGAYQRIGDKVVQPIGNNMYIQGTGKTAQIYQLISSGGHTHLIPLPTTHKSNSATPVNQSGGANYSRTPGSANGPAIMRKPSSLTKQPNQTAPSQVAGAQQNTIPSKPGEGGDKGKGHVICEICDGYIRDTEQLRVHMQWIHKVKIHPKMLASGRPPLNCQKCQWRFFTDAGLERHLLGAHGLVTSNMQDLVNQNKDDGRCTTCGRVFASKLVAHMNQVHKLSLKPAHLSYKCTVCTETFNLYRLFESHVYKVHSNSMKRPSDKGTPGGGPAEKRSRPEDSTTITPTQPPSSDSGTNMIGKSTATDQPHNGGDVKDKPVGLSLPPYSIYSKRCPVCKVSCDDEEQLESHILHRHLNSKTVGMNPVKKFDQHAGWSETIVDSSVIVRSRFPIAASGNEVCDPHESPDEEEEDFEDVADQESAQPSEAAAQEKQDDPMGEQQLNGKESTPIPDSDNPQQSSAAAAAVQRPEPITINI